MFVWSVCVVLMATFVSGVVTCPCPAQTAQEHLCTSQFSALVYVQNKGKVLGQDVVYKVQTLRTYRSDNLAGINRRHLHISQNETQLCGTKLQAGKYYIISGHYSDRQPFLSRMYTTSCDVQVKFDRNPYFVYTPPTCSSEENSSGSLKFKSLSALFRL